MSLSNIVDGQTLCKTCYRCGNEERESRKSQFSFPYFEETFQKFNEMRRNEILYDVVLKAKGVSFKCHRLILSSSSPYFLAMFTNGMLEANQNEIEIQKISHPTLNAIIDYMYTKQIKLHPSNVILIYEASILFQLHELTSQARKFLKRRIFTHNCLDVLQLAELYQDSILKSSAKLHFQKNFKEVCKQGEFYELSFECLEEIISENLLTASETCIFESIENWIMYDLDRRIGFCIKLIQKVRFGLIPTSYLIEEISRSFLVEKSKEFNALYIDLLRNNISILLKKEQKEKSSIQNIIEVCSVERLKESVDEPCIYLLGGERKDIVESTESFDWNKQEWHSRSCLSFSRSRAGYVLSNDMIFCIGGFDGKHRLNGMLTKNKKHSTSLRSMNSVRETFGCVSLSGFIYAIGGFNGSKGVKEVEKYSIQNNQWTSYTPLFQSTSCLTATINEGVIYAIGGYSGEHEAFLNVCVRNDPRMKHWMSLSQMNESRSGLTACSTGNYIYVFGGHNPRVLSSVEVYDVRRDAWFFVNEMPQIRRNACSILYNDLIFLIGGDDEKEYYSAVNIFDPLHNEWNESGLLLKEARSHAGCLILNQS